ncbi:MAG: aminotransferase class V-fold PLP-dependent enzyme [Heliomarina sp.]|uniref:aminotransferase class V-fold PLP-dependent enzyme n=1 Tax=Heliomarina sp. TaxID=2917556 RepID=UPI0040584A06
MKLDSDYVRSLFPAFSKPELAAFAHFENAGGSYACAPVIERLTRFYTERKMQPYGDADPSRLGGEEMDEARARMAALLGVEKDELSFGPSTTQNTYVLAQAFRQWLSPGEAIIVTNQDHEANSGPWRRLAEEGIEIREWRVDPDSGLLNPEDLEDLLDEKVRLVCFPHCSNVVAHINPVTEITAMAHAAGAFVCVDGVSYAPHGFPDLNALGPDIYLFSAYKTYGPHQGLMVVRRALAELLPNQGHYFNGDSIYKKFTPAGPDHAQIAACAGMADYIDLLGAHHGFTGSDAVERGQFVHDLMRGQETTLLQPLLDAVKSRNAVRLLGPDRAEGRAPTVALALTQDPVKVAKALAERGIIAGASDFYAHRVLEGIGVSPETGVLRLSFTHYTTQGEMDKLLNALDDLL